MQYNFKLKFFHRNLVKLGKACILRKAREDRSVLSSGMFILKFLFFCLKKSSYREGRWLKWSVFALFNMRTNLLILFTKKSTKKFHCSGMTWLQFIVHCYYTYAFFILRLNQLNSTEQWLQVYVLTEQFRRPEKRDFHLMIIKIYILSFFICNPFTDYYYYLQQ